jgi:hypothetical protein
MMVRRPKETEREAKEKEFADGQHANFIDGVWHCSNCGCPEGIAIGRRKGPLGEKSQCGTCGTLSLLVLYAAQSCQVNIGIDIGALDQFHTVQIPNSTLL